MKKPDPNPRLGRFYTAYQYIDCCTEYTPNELREIADELEEEGVITIDFEVYDDVMDNYVTRMESEEEAKQRYERDLKLFDNHMGAMRKAKAENEKHREYIFTEARKLGML